MEPSSGNPLVDPEKNTGKTIEPPTPSSDAVETPKAKPKLDPSKIYPTPTASQRVDSTQTAQTTPPDSNNSNPVKPVAVGLKAPIGVIIIGVLLLIAAIFNLLLAWVFFRLGNLISIAGLFPAIWGILLLFGGFGLIRLNEFARVSVLGLVLIGVIYNGYYLVDYLRYDSKIRGFYDEFEQLNLMIL